MLLAGDEVGHTQQGNNNTYCQDNDLTWIDWELTASATGFLKFVQKLTRFRREQPVLRRRTFFQGQAIRGSGVADVAWFSPVGDELTDRDWEQPTTLLGMRLAGDLIRDTDDRGEPIVGDTLFVAINGSVEDVSFTLPGTHPDHLWELVIDTSDDDRPPELFAGGHRSLVAAHSITVFRTRPRVERDADVTPLQAETIRKAAEGSRPLPAGGP
jgi:glycogen operon protein